MDGPGIVGSLVSRPHSPITSLHFPSHAPPSPYMSLPTQQLFVTRASEARLLRLPGVSRLAAKGKVVLTVVPLAFEALGRRELMLSPWLWRTCLADKVT